MKKLIDITLLCHNCFHLCSRIAGRRGCSAASKSGADIHWRWSCRSRRQTTLKLPFRCLQQIATIPADMFAQAPDLPPCGSNTKASRTWVDLLRDEWQTFEWVLLTRKAFRFRGDMVCDRK